VVAVLEVVLSALAPWPSAGDLSTEQWERYIEAARELQQADPGDTERTIAEFVGRRSGFDAAEDETRVFLLLRVVFDLPERAPADERRAYAGWVNWPPPDADGNVNLSWPITWETGRPALIAPYEGSEGESYAAPEEYRYLRTNFRFRAL
jgi:hypothetical protein